MTQNTHLVFPAARQHHGGPPDLRVVRAFHCNSSPHAQQVGQQRGLTCHHVPTNEVILYYNDATIILYHNTIPFNIPFYLSTSCAIFCILFFNTFANFSILVNLYFSLNVA